MRFSEVGFGKGIGIDDQNPVGLEVSNVHFQRGGIHDNENVDRVAGRVNFVGREMKLVATDSGERTRRGAYFGGEVGECGDIVAVKGDGIGELAAGDLHTVAGVSGEADHSAVNDFAFVLRQRNVGGGGHASLQLPRENRLGPQPPTTTLEGRAF